MLAYAGVCWRMLAYAGVCWRMLLAVHQVSPFVAQFFGPTKEGKKDSEGSDAFGGGAGRGGARSGGSRGKVVLGRGSVGGRYIAL
jgi:hypothetical protein